MFLILGNNDDALARSVCERLTEEGFKVLFLGEEEALRAPIVIEHEGKEPVAVMHVRGETIDLCRLRGVLVRLARKLWPSREFRFKDQTFVYHETAAAWFRLLSLLPGKVVNRYGFGWWVQESLYNSELSAGLSAALSIPRKPTEAPRTNGRLLPEPPPGENGCGSVYVVGRRMLADRAGGDPSFFLASRWDALKSWQEQTGIAICRIDFDLEPAPVLRHVESFPLLENAPPSLAGEITEAVLEAIR